MTTTPALFYIFSAVMLFAAFRVITARSPVYAALYLVLAFFSAACVWMLLRAEFLSIALILVYVGAVMVLFLFGVMLTRAKLGVDAELNNKNHLLGVPVALLMLGVMVYVLLDGFGDTRLPADRQPVPIQELSDSIFKPYLLPFWAISFVLLAAVIGAIVLARKD